MRTRLWVPVAVAVLLPLPLAGTAQATTADTTAPRDSDQRTAAPDRRVPDDFWFDRDRGRHKDRDDRPAAQPRNDTLVDVPVNPNDASIPLGLIPYHEFAPRLRALQASDRINVEVAGQSVLGRDIHLVVATSPMSDDEWNDWQELSDLRTADPKRALKALAAGEYDDWKTPLLINNNIHGNEWEGTDATFRVLDELAFSDDPAVTTLLDEHVLTFIVSMNPDGRVAGTRANAAGFDMNRDFITQSQPENLVVRDQLLRYDPLTMLDIHGYVGTTLIEPATGPHGENYDYDLYIRNALPHALAMEQRVLADNAEDYAARYPGVTQTIIPFRDFTDGWDDWPPIFTPMYAMYHGAVGHTIEIPLNPRGIADVTERLDRTRINTNVAESTIRGSLEWVNANQGTLLADQLEMYRRGEAGEPTRGIDDPLALATGLDVNLDTFVTEFPDAYVIPAGDGQRSDDAAARLAQFLIDNDVEVRVAQRPVTVAGERYPRGSYVVDMKQAKRGLASAVLALGRDVTENFPTMYDISAWSNAELWGASVVRVEDGRLDLRALPVTTRTAPTGEARPSLFGFTLDVKTVADVQSANALLDAGVPVTRLGDGTLHVGLSSWREVRDVAEEFGVSFDRATRQQYTESRTAAPLPDVAIAFAGPADELAALTRMGFDVTPVTTAGFNDDTVAFADFEAMFVSSTAVNPLAFDAEAQQAFADWLAAGGTVVGRGLNGVTFNNRAALLEVQVASGRSDANGIVEVVNDPESTFMSDALTRSFVSSPRYFPVVGDGVQVDQRLGEGDFFLAGHWIGQEAAAGQPVVVSGTARGADVTLFGTEPLYRSHPEGLFPQVAGALWR